MGIPKNAIEEVLNSKGTKNFISTYIANTVDYLFQKQDEEIPLTKEDLVNLLKSNIDIIQSELPEEEKSYLNNYEEKLYNYIEENDEEILKFFPTPKEILNKVDQEQITIIKNFNLKDLTTFISTIINNKTIYIIIFSLIILEIILIIMNYKKALWSKYLFLTSIIYSFIMIFIEIIISTIIKTDILNKAKGANTIINYLLNAICKYVWVGILIAIFVSIISYIIYKRKRKEGL